MAELEPLGILGLEGIHYYVRDLERSERFYVDRMDFEEIAESSPALSESGHQRARVFRAGQYVVMCSSPVGEGGRADRYLKKHPDGVGTLAFSIKNAERAFTLLDGRGATPISEVETFHDDGGTLKTFSITTPFGDTTFRFVERRGYRGFFPGFVELDPVRGGQNRCGVSAVDHITSNFQTMSPALLWMEHVLGFERYWDVEFHTRDVGRVKLRDGSGLRSVVMWDKNSGLKFANNEPYRPNFKASQINLFNEQHHGDGVQHIALEVRDITSAVRELRARGVEFMPTPSTYYDALPERLRELDIEAIDESVEALRELELLVDGHGLKSYLLQIFLKDSAGLYGNREAGPFFYELIQRKGDSGFGAGNFRALFESIERQQLAEQLENAGESALMLERLSKGIVPHKPHTALRGSSNELRYEECITRAGFDGPYTIVYHERRPHEAEPIVTEHGWRIEAGRSSPSLMRYHFKTFEQRQRGGPALDARIPLLENDDLVISILAPDREDPAYFVNADADELFFFRAGGGVLKTQLGELRFRANDYLCLPKGLLHRFVPDAALNQDWLVVESSGAIGIPRQYRNEIGQLRMDAPYSHRDFRAPEFTGPNDEGIANLVVKRGNAFFGFQYAGSPLDVVGWDGTYYPVAFSILDFAPKVGLVHLPPNVHATFALPGALVCSFVPRLLDFHPNAIACPYPHSSVDIDEVLYYVRDNFTSRTGVAAGSMSLHPAGIPHGPHPGAYEARSGSSRTEEFAVMLDCLRPLRVTAAAFAISDAAYHHSFVDPGGSHSMG